MTRRARIAMTAVEDDGIVALQEIPVGVSHATCAQISSLTSNERELAHQMPGRSPYAGQLEEREASSFDKVFHGVRLSASDIPSR